jgi:hypothetical protein
MNQIEVKDSGHQAHVLQMHTNGVKTQDQLVIPKFNLSLGVYVASLKAGGKLMDNKKIIVVK